MDLGISGLASGFDWKSFVDQMMAVERTPENNLRTEQSTIQERNNAFTSIKTQLSTLSSRVTALKDASLYSSRTVSVADATVASASASAGAPIGSYTFNITQLATAAAQQGATNVGGALNATSDPLAQTLDSAAFASSVTAGTFTVNGKIIAVATSDTLQSVFDRISAATGGTVTGGYDAAADKITLSSSGEIVLGSATDTSNFLQVAKLQNNGTGSVTSTSALGSIKLASTLATANFATTVTDGGGGAGKFKINGVEISFNATTDSVSGVLQRINDSGAGVIASYDSSNDQFTLTNNTTGDMGMALEDVTGNFLAATGLTGGTLHRGQNLLYTINGGGQLTSQSNTITETSSGLSGLSVTALKESSTTVTVGSDTAKITTAINDFLSEYNKTQAMIDSQTASSTDASGKVTAGVLAGDSDANDIASRLRSIVNGAVSGLSGTLKRLDGLGIASNGYDDNLALSDSTDLDSALTNNLNGVRDLFANTTDGLAVQLSSYLDSTIGDDGTLVSHQATLTKQSSDIDTQISDMERQIQDDQQRMTDSFVAMETAQATINQQMQFLQQQLGIQSS